MTFESLILLSMIAFAVVFANLYFWFNRCKYIRVDNEISAEIINNLSHQPQSVLKKIYQEVNAGVYDDV